MAIIVFNNAIKEFLSDKLLLWGFIGIIASTLVFFLSDSLAGKGQQEFGIFFINYFISVLYSLALWIYTQSCHGWRWSRGKIEYTLLMLQLWMISAFSLNRELNVFNTSTSWLTSLIFISALSLMLSVFYDYLPKIAKHLIGFFLGTSLLLYIYYSLYLLPLYIISAPALVALGISFHTYIPAFLSIISAIKILKIIKKTTIVSCSIAAGVSIPILVVIIFTLNWRSVNHQIAEATSRNILNEGKLPDWTVISQRIPANFIAERVIKSDLVFSTLDFNGSWWFGNFGSMLYNEPRQHDPLVIIASLFAGTPDLDEKSKVKILKSMRNSRHYAQERLWSGDMLEVSNIITNVKFYPRHRIAYTEKTVSIKNTSRGNWAFPQEALFTFHLPEGAVVSSMSLWIDGREEKALLTSKSKADSAYRTIVGVERRDPSVVHWQEGNTVSVRVFPCTAREVRKFKIGITSPLLQEGSDLLYQNIYFEGPDTKSAEEMVQIAFESGSKKYKSTLNLEANGEDRFISNSGDYVPDWNISFLAPPLSNQAFTFNGNSYKIEEFKKTYSAIECRRVYLDLNNTWSKKEFDDVFKIVRNSEVYVYDGKIVRLTAENRNAEFNTLKELNFSLFPFYSIEQPESSIVISKNPESSPNLSDLTASIFGDKLKKYFSQANKVRVFDIGYETAPFVKALKELRVISYDKGSIADLDNIVQKKFFYSPQETESFILLNSNIGIRKTEDTVAAGSGPDHLLRLFAYNAIMKRVGGNFFNQKYIEDELVHLAAEANIVSPLSSLIVLETKADYERFGIEQSKDSIRNASMHSSGAVPEPQEWMLICMFAAVVIYLNRAQLIKTFKVA